MTDTDCLIAFLTVCTIYNRFLWFVILSPIRFTIERHINSHHVTTICKQSITFIAAYLLCCSGGLEVCTWRSMSFGVKVSSFFCAWSLRPLGCPMF